MPPAYVKPYVKTQKNDEADAEAICEAVTRPNMRFSEVKTVEQQSVLVLHRSRAMLIKHCTRMGNTIRAHLAEFGVAESIDRMGHSRLIHMIVSGDDARLTDATRRALMMLVEQYRLLQGQILDLDRQVMAWHRSNSASKRLATIPGTACSERARCLRRRCFELQEREKLRSLRWLGAKTIIERRERASWENIEAWRPLPEVASDRRRHCSHPIRATSWHASPLAG
jgi:transposase